MLIKISQEVEKSYQTQAENEPKVVEKLDKSHLIIVEGKDDAKFLEKFCDVYNVNTSNIELHIIGGCDKLKKYLSTLDLTTGYKKLKSISIIFDADNDFKKSFEDIEDAFKNITKDIIQNIYLFPNNKDNGILEDIILSNKIFFSDEIKQNINDFFHTVKNTDKEEKFPLNEYSEKDPHNKSIMGAVFTARFKDVRGLVGLFSVLKQQNKTDEFLKNISPDYSEPFLEFLQKISSYDPILS